MRHRVGPPESVYYYLRMHADNQIPEVASEFVDLAAEVLGLLSELNREDGTTVVMVTHDERQAAKTHRVLRLFDGRPVS